MERRETPVQRRDHASSIFQATIRSLAILLEVSLGRELARYSTRKEKVSPLSLRASRWSNFGSSSGTDSQRTGQFLQPHQASMGAGPTRITEGKKPLRGGRQKSPDLAPRQISIAPMDRNSNDAEHACCTQRYQALESVCCFRTSKRPRGGGSGRCISRCIPGAEGRMASVDISAIQCIRVTVRVFRRLAYLEGLKRGNILRICSRRDIQQ